MVNRPLIRPAISWGGSFGWVPLDCQDLFSKGDFFLMDLKPMG